MPPVFLADRDAFAYEFAATEIKWSARSLSRLLRATGERPERVAEMRFILNDLGMESGCGGHWIGIGGVFDHGEMWSRFGFPWIIVGHPYGIDADERVSLAELARFSGLLVNVDDRPSYYGYRTHHVRIELAERRRPWKQLPSTRKTRAAKRAVCKAFDSELAWIPMLPFRPNK